MSAETTVQNAYDRAQAAYTQHLNEEERERINVPTSLSDLISQAKAMGADLGNKNMGKWSTMIQGLGNEAATFEPLEKLVEGACRMAPVAGGMIWSSVSFILQMTKDNAKVFDKVRKFFETIAEEIAHFSLEEKTFATSPLVQSVVGALYGAILDFWVEAVKYYRSKHRNPLVQIKNFVLSSIIDKKFTELEKKIAKQKDRLRGVAIAEHHADSAAFIDESRLRERSSLRSRVKKWLNAPDYERDFQAAVDLRHEGTCEWLKEKEAYIKWTTTDSKPFLFIHGIPGSGKTVLSSWTIHDARSLSTQSGTRAQTLRTFPKTHGALVLHHHFKHDNKDKCTPTSAIRSLIDQLMNYYIRTKNPLLLQLESSLDTISVLHTHNIEYAKLWDIFHESISAFIRDSESAFIRAESDSVHAESAIHPPIVTSVLDAMDECEGEYAQTLVKNLLDLSSESKGKFKVLVTGRKFAWDLIKSAWDLFNRDLSPAAFRVPLIDLEITLEDVQQDIGDFVRHTISSISRLSPHESLRNDLSDEIAKPENNQGMFLWAFLSCETAKRQVGLLALRSLLHRLPKGLDATYERICHAIVERDDDDGGDRLSILKWIANSPRPLKFSELRVGFRLMREQATNYTLMPAQSNHGTDEDLILSGEEIVDECRNLVTYTGADKGDSFALVHLSASHFFRRDLSHLTRSKTTEETKDFISKIHDAEPTLGILCLDYLLSEALQSDSYFSTSLAFRVIPPQSTEKDRFLQQYPLFDFAAVLWVDFVLNELRRGAPPSPLGPDLLAKAATFVADPFADVCLAHLIRQASIEAAMNILLDFAQSSVSRTGDSHTNVIVHWADDTMKILRAYKISLSDHPELLKQCRDIHIVVCNIDDPPCSTGLIDDPASRDTIPPLETTAGRTWVHYNTRNGMLHSIDVAEDGVQLRGQIMMTGSSIKPGVSEACSSPSKLLSASISPSGQLIAAIFGSYFRATVICWRLPPLDPISSRPMPQPGLILTDSIEARMNYRFDKFNPGLIAFRGEDTVVTSFAMWDLKKGERLESCIGSSEGYPHTIFSSDGERAVRGNLNLSLGNYGLQVLNTRDGVPISGFEVPNCGSLLPRAISRSGRKIVCSTAPPNFPKPSLKLPPPKHICFFVDSATTVSLECLGGHQNDLEFAQFTHDEDVLVGCLTTNAARDPIAGQSDPDTWPMIALWNIAENNTGHGRAIIYHLFRSSSSRLDFTFCLAPKTHQSLRVSDYELIIINESGAITRRALNQPWSEGDDEGSESQLPQVRNIHGTELIKIIRGMKALTINLIGMLTNNRKCIPGHRHLFKSWSFSLGERQAPIVHETTVPDFVPIRWLSSSSSGTSYAYVDEKGVVTISRPGSATILKYPLPFTNEDIITVLFTTTDEHDFMTTLHYDRCTSTDSTVTLTVFDANAESTSKLSSLSVPNFNPRKREQRWPCDLIPVPGNPSDIGLLTYSSDAVSGAVVATMSQFRVTRDNVRWIMTGTTHVDNNVVLKALPIDEMPPDFHRLSLSSCGKYLVQYDVESCFPLKFQMPDLHTQGTQRQTSHPDSLKVHAFKVHNPWIFKLRGYSKASPVTSLSLHRKLIHGNDKQRRSRTVCVLTDQIITQNSSISLQWPEDKDSEVTVTSVSTEEIIVMATGITSGDMMDEDAWVSESEVEDEDLVQDPLTVRRVSTRTHTGLSPLFENLT